MTRRSPADAANIRARRPPSIIEIVAPDAGVEIGGSMPEESAALIKNMDWKPSIIDMPASVFMLRVNIMLLEIALAACGGRRLSLRERHFSRCLGSNN